MQFGTMTEWETYDTARGGWGQVAIVRLQELWPVSRVEILWGLPFVRVRLSPRSQKDRGLVYPRWATQREVNARYLTPHRNPDETPRLYLGVMNGAKLSDFGVQLERTDHKTVKYYWVSELATLESPEFADLMSEAYAVAGGKINKPLPER